MTWLTDLQVYFLNGFCRIPRGEMCRNEVKVGNEISDILQIAINKRTQDEVSTNDFVTMSLLQLEQTVKLIWNLWRIRFCCILSLSASSLQNT